jgi:hypothetical protein
MKLKDIIFEQESFSTQKVDKDKETGTITWDVTYTPIISLDRNMQRMYNDFVDVLRKYPNDPKLEQIFSDFSNMKKNLRTHITRRYKK